jgi:hypothetical protein
VAGSLIQSISKSVSGVNNTTLAFGSPLTAGNLVVATQQHYLPVDQPASLPVDTLTQTYVEAIQQLMDFVGDGSRLATWFVENCLAGADTVTFDMGGTAINGSLSCVLAEFSGVDTTGALSDAVGTENVGGDSFPTSPAITQDQADEMIWGAMMYDLGGATMTPGGGFTEVQEIEAAPISTIYRNVSSIAAWTANWELTIDRRWMCHAVSFKAGAPTRRWILGSH